MTERARFTVEVEMEERWVPQFLGLLQTMQALGRMGSSRMLGFFADGDGDFHPQFEFDVQSEVAGGHGGGDRRVDTFWDAG